MSDAIQTIRKGEKRPFYGSASAESGTLTLTGATVTLYDGAGVVVEGFDGIAVSGSSGTGTAELLAWLNLDTADLVPGVYTLAFAIAANGSDSLPRIFGPTLEIAVQAVIRDLTQWPSAADVLDQLASAGITVRSGAPLQNKLAGVVSEVGQRTQRQFQPPAEDADDEVRYFDGNGTAQLDVDELVELTSVTVIGVQSDPGYTLANVQLVYQQERPRTLLSVGQGSLPALGPTAFPRFFPAGRQNIAVTGRWGYAATIPADLWEAVCAEAAARAGNAAIFKPDGRLEEWKDDDVSVKRNLATTAVSVEGLEPTVALGWHRQYEAAVRRYKRPVGRKLRRLVGSMI